LLFWEVLPRFGPPFRSVPAVFAPFGSVAVFAPPLGLSFPADIGRDGFCAGPISIPKLLVVSPFGSVTVFAPPLGLSFPADIGRDGFCTGPISMPNLWLVSPFGPVAAFAPPLVLSVCFCCFLCRRHPWGGFQGHTHTHLKKYVGISWSCPLGVCTISGSGSAMYRMGS
jgi:hypothetical protein